MKTHEIILEAMMDPDLRKMYVKKGYKYLGAGQDADTFLAPDGSITKIFGTGPESSEHKFTKGQQSFIDFAKYCSEHADNPYLPQIQRWNKFEYPKGSDFWYLEINVERLFDFDKAISAGGKKYDFEYLAKELEELGDYIDRHGARGPAKYLKDTEEAQSDDDDYYLGYKDDMDASNELIMNLGKEGFKQLSQALVDLRAIANRKGYAYDLHSGNFMLSSEGHMVINDPFFTGSRRKKPSRSEW